VKIEDMLEALLEGGGKTLREVLDRASARPEPSVQAETFVDMLKEMLTCGNAMDVAGIDKTVKSLRTATQILELLVADGDANVHQRAACETQGQVQRAIVDHLLAVRRMRAEKEAKKND